MKQVLLVEDDELNRTVIEDIILLDEIEAALSCVESGEDAIEHTRNHKPDLILMDVGLPGIDGLEATRRIRSEPVLCDIPIWALTAHAMKGDAEKALIAGCNEYITKPIDCKLFANRLRNFFS